MYIIQVDIRGFKYYVKQKVGMYTNGYTLQGLMNNATAFDSEDAARCFATMHKIEFEKIIYQL